MTRPAHEVEAALRLVTEGCNDCEISRRMGIPRGTIRDWRHGRVPGARLRATGPGRPVTVCPICSGDGFDGREDGYAYLLGMYLGDGCISPSGRTHKLRVFCDARYPGIIASCAESMETICPEKHAWVGAHGPGCRVVTMHWNHWPCLFPQHGPGRKHKRPIYLADWQEDIVSRNHESLIRGLIQSDGCRTVANDRGVTSIRYHFDNLSEDIKRIYCSSLEALGIHWTRPSYKDIAVYRKADTARLDEFVGPKR